MKTTNKIIKLHIPLDQYEFMEIDFEGTPEEAIEESNRIKGFYSRSKTDKTGMSTKDFSTFKRNFLVTNKYTMEEKDALNKAQAWWLHETQKTLQQIEKLN